MAEGSIRDRRAARTRAGAWKDAARRGLKPLGMIAVLALLAGLLYAATQVDRSAPAGGPRDQVRHWHAVLKVFLDGSELDLHHCEFDLNGCDRTEGSNYLAAHLHYEDTIRHLVHIEHPVKAGNVTLEKFFDRHGMNLTADTLRLDARVHDGRSYGPADGRALQIWVNNCIDGPDDWRLAREPHTVIPLQHDRILLTWTDRTKADLADQFAAFPDDRTISDEASDACPRVVGTSTAAPP